MADPQDHPALERLLKFERRGQQRTPAAPPRMGYQPSLDGIRAMSVIGVILYHAGFTWMHGGFFGVEVFFVVSGFLITSLLIEERDKTKGVALKAFWIRRFRRLLPALFAVLVAVGVWAVFWGTAEQHTQLRHDYPWGIFYLANWGQIFSQVSYFSGTPTLFRHLWSLAVEEQWYAIWPLVFIAINRSGARSKRADQRRGSILLIVSFSVMVGTALAASAKVPTTFFNPFRLATQSVDHINFLYLSTITRSSGLLLGAAMAFLWRPWRIGGKPKGNVAGVLDVAAVVAVIVLIGAFFTGHVAEEATYLWLLPLVTIASAVLVAVVVHPWATGARLVFSSRPMVEIGKRSYGLYVWSWPIMRILDAYKGSWPKFLLAAVITVPVSELCYRFIESPIRAGSLSTWWNGRQRRDWSLITACAGVSTVVLASSLVFFFGSADKVFDAAKDNSSGVVFDPNAVGATSTTAAAAVTTEPSVTAESTTSTTTGPTVPVTAAVLPRHLVIVGDSTAHALAVNLPDGIEGTFTINDGSVQGCSVYSAGTAVSAQGFKRSFTGCGDWVRNWVFAAKEMNADVALVVIGAWDVFDVNLGGQVVPFDSPTVDQRFTDGVQQGIDALTAIGVKVALLEVPCMRPQDVEGAGTPALPERANDTRVAHVNELLREVAAKNPETTTFVVGPPQYCADESIASSLAYRWDGVHAYKPGAKLTFEAIAQALLTIPVG
ncbi:MAG: acyltransferase family protein [Actinomycetota bacterium]|nr:acyltransferase family protein [Actinomycetota bacterium]